MTDQPETSVQRLQLARQIADERVEAAKDEAREVVSKVAEKHALPALLGLDPGELLGRLAFVPGESRLAREVGRQLACEDLERQP